MASTINTNLASLMTQNNLNKSQSVLETTIKRLSSGLRVNSAKDDAAGYAISSRMDSIIRGQNVAQRNVNDGISMVQTTDGALSQINDNLQRMRELAVQAANGSLTDSDRDSLNAEFNNLQQEISRITSSTKFNGKNLFDGQAITLQVGAGTSSNDQVNIDAIDLTSATSEVRKVTQSMGPNSYTAYKVARDAIQTYINTKPSNVKIWMTTPDSVSSLGPTQAQMDTYNAALNSYLNGAGAAALTAYQNAMSTFLSNTQTGNSFTNPWTPISLGPTQLQLDAYNNAYNTYLNSASPAALQAFNQAKAAYLSTPGTSFTNPWTPYLYGTSAPQSVLTTMQNAVATFESSLPASVVADFHNAYLTVVSQGAWVSGGQISNLVSDQVGVTNMQNAIATFESSLPASVVADFHNAYLTIVSQGAWVGGGQISNLVRAPQVVIDTFNNAKSTYNSSIPQSVVDAYQQATNNFLNTGGYFNYSISGGVVPVLHVTTQSTLNTFLTAQAAYYAAGQQGNTLSSQSGASSALEQIDKAISEVNKASIKCGATENRLSSIISTLQVSTENQIAARSRIMDTDYALETAHLARSQILQQAGLAMLAQANQLPNGVMSLLR